MTLLAISNGRSRAGFTLMELLLSVAFIAIVTAAAVPLYSRLHVSTQLNESTSELAHTIRIARTRSVAWRNDTPHGVYMSTSSYTLYQGSSYAARDTSYDQVTTLENTLGLSTTLTGNEVNFSKGLGVPNTTGTITLTHDGQGSRTITIDSLGSVQQ